MTRELPKVYDPAVVEGDLYAWWEKEGLFHADPEADGEPFSIVIPPPNVTGSLHVGHALDNTIQDLLIRHARMRGRNAVWLPGTDHAGIATQNVVERQLAKEGLSRHDIGREAFLDRVWSWREEYGGIILRQLRRLGAACDWDREAFTFDQPRSRAVREVFVSLYEQGLIYRGNRLINWCPRCQSALSDIEVDHADEPGELAYLRYPGSDGSEGVVVATTRAETMLGDTGVAVHPDDERYQHLIGRSVVLPLMEREIPVVADAHVDPEFGTGAVKVTPAHDPNDYEIGQRHGLEIIDVMTDDAVIGPAGGHYAGMDRFDARERIKSDLAALGLLEKVEQREHSVGHCSRCGTVVEPRLSDQWFVSVAPLASAASEAVRDGRTTFVPQRQAKGFLDWLDNLQDWCISRQIWWGHRIPAWYDADGGIHVLRSDPTPEEIQAKGLVRDDDVLDTWFSSALWPFTTLGWEHPDSDTPELRSWYPTTVLVTAYDINTFWVSRMLMMGLRFMDQVPFHTVFNHGLVRDKHGKKMSKSFGNVIDPLELIDRYGADALRFALLRASAPGQDVPLAEEWVEGARRFTNKLWNAARFVLMQVEGTPGSRPPDELELEDRWILSRLEATRAAVDDGFEHYDLSAVARALYHFVWDDYCDWYLELAKLRQDDSSGQVLTFVLDAALRLLHPLMPFVTEQIWRTLHEAGDDDPRSLMRAPWPRPAPERADAAAEARMDVVRDAVTVLRRFRAEHGLPPSARIAVTVVARDTSRTLLDEARDGIARLAGVSDWTIAEAPPSGPVGKIVATHAELYVGLEGLVDLDEERQRLSRELSKAEAEAQRAEHKLANPSFVEKAPPEVVAAERQKRDDWQRSAGKLREQLEQLG